MFNITSKKIVYTRDIYIIENKFINTIGTSILDEKNNINLDSLISLASI